MFGGQLFAPDGTLYCVVGFFQLLILFLNVIYLLSVSEHWLRTQPYGFITPRAGVSEHYVT
jgi:hypothetical protein